MFSLVVVVVFGALLRSTLGGIVCVGDEVPILAPRREMPRMLTSETLIRAFAQGIVGIRGNTKDDLDVGTLLGATTIAQRPRKVLSVASSSDNVRPAVATACALRMKTVWIGSERRVTRDIAYGPLNGPEVVVIEEGLEDEMKVQGGKHMVVAKGTGLQVARSVLENAGVNWVHSRIHGEIVEDEAVFEGVDGLCFWKEVGSAVAHHRQLFEQTLLGNSSGNGTIPWTVNEITQYNIFVWSVVVLIFATAATIFCVMGAENTNDPILRTKFRRDDSHLHED